MWARSTQSRLALACRLRPPMPAEAVRSEAAGIAHDIAVEGWGERGVGGGGAAVSLGGGQCDEGTRLSVARRAEAKVSRKSSYEPGRGLAIAPRLLRFKADGNVEP